MIVAFHTTHEDGEVNLGIAEGETLGGLVAEITQQVKGISDSPVVEVFCYESRESVEVGFAFSDQLEGLVFGELC